MDWENVKIRMPGKYGAVSEKPTKYRAQPKQSRSPAEQVDHDKVLYELTVRRSNINANGNKGYSAGACQERCRQVDAYRELATSLHPTHFVTFKSAMNVNSPMSAKPETVASNITKFCCRLERMALGKKWNKCSRDRIRLLGFPEHPNTNLHYHALLSVPEVTRTILECEGETIWKTLCPTGEFHERTIDNAERAVRYATKDLHHGWALENVVVYTPKTTK